jgi:hypothetical protein
MRFVIERAESSSLTGNDAWFLLAGTLVEYTR